MEFQEFRAAFMVLHDNFSGPNDQRLNSRMTSYWGYFKNVADVAVFSRAVQIYLETAAGSNTYFPAVGAIIAIMPPTDAQQEFDEADRVSDDWLETLQRKIGQVGSHE